MFHIVSAVALTASLATASVDSTELRREDLMSVLKSGGYTVILRHARTDRSFQEKMGEVPKDRSEQRNLSDDGIRDAALMGVVFRKYGISFAEIISSPMYRTIETAEMAAGKPTSVTMALRVIPPTAEQAALVKAAPKKGTNRLLVTHHFVIETHVPGIKPGDVAESEAAVIRHLPDGSIELVGRITLDDWQQLAVPGHKATGPSSAAAPATHGGASYTAPLTAAPSPTTPVSIPDTHAGHLGREYIAAFNSGDPQKMRAYIEAYMVADPARPTDERLKSYAKLFADHGPLTVATVDTSLATHLVLGMKSKVGDFKFTVKSSDTEPMKISSITFAVMQPGGHR